MSPPATRATLKNEALGIMLENAQRCYGSPNCQKIQLAWSLDGPRDETDVLIYEMRRQDMVGESAVSRCFREQVPDIDFGVRILQRIARARGFDDLVTLVLHSSLPGMAVTIHPGAISRMELGSMFKLADEIMQTTDIPAL